MQKSPVQPGVQWQAPSSELQRAPLWQLHVWKQAGPQNPDGQAGGGWDGKVRARQRAEEREGEDGKVYLRVQMPGCTQLTFPDYGGWVGTVFPKFLRSLLGPGFSLSPNSQL